MNIVSKFRSWSRQLLGTEQSKSSLKKTNTPNDRGRARAEQLQDSFTQSSVQAPLKFKFKPGWDNYQSSETDVRKAIDRKDNIKSVQCKAEAIQTFGNRVAHLDNGPHDLNDQVGTIILDRCSIDQFSDVSYDGALIQFDSEHNIVKADLQWDSDSIVFEQKSDKLVFAKKNYGWTHENTVHADNRITYVKRKN